MTWLILTIFGSKLKKPVTVGLSDFRTVRLSDYRTVKLSDCSTTLTVVFSQLFLLTSSLNDVVSFTVASRHGAATAPRYLFRMVLPLASLIALADILSAEWDELDWVGGIRVVVGMNDRCLLRGRRWKGSRLERKELEIGSRWFRRLSRE